MIHFTEFYKAALLLILFILGCSSPGDTKITSGAATFKSIVGVPIFGIESENYPCAEALKIFDRVAYKMTSVLSHTFGEKKECLRRFLALPAKRTHVQVYFDNGSGRRFERLMEGELFPDLSAEEYNEAWEALDERVVRAYRSRLMEWVDFISEVQREDLSFSGVLILEDNLSLDAVHNMAEVAREVWPYELGWNPEKNYGYYSIVDVDFFELHGDRSDFPSGIRCRSNLDGLQPNLGREPELELSAGVLSDSGLISYLNRTTQLCDYVQIWDKEISNGGHAWDSWSPPRDRTFPVDPLVVQFLNDLLIQFNGKL